MTARIVDVVLNPELFSTKEIIETHKSVKISKVAYREFVRSFILICSPNEEFKKAAKLMFVKLEKVMVTQSELLPKVSHGIKLIGGSGSCLKTIWQRS